MIYMVICMMTELIPKPRSPDAKSSLCSPEQLLPHPPAQLSQLQGEDGMGRTKLCRAEKGLLIIERV